MIRAARITFFVTCLSLTIELCRFWWSKPLFTTVYGSTAAATAAVATAALSRCCGHRYVKCCVLSNNIAPTVSAAHPTPACFVVLQFHVRHVLSSIQLIVVTIIGV